MDWPSGNKWNTKDNIIVYTRRKKGNSSVNNVSQPKEVISSNSKSSVAKTGDNGSRKIGEDGSVPEGYWRCPNCAGNGGIAKNMNKSKNLASKKGKSSKKEKGGSSLYASESKKLSK